MAAPLLGTVMGFSRGTQRAGRAGRDGARVAVDLSTLSLADVRRLLELAERRGQSALAGQLRAELDARNGVLPPRIRLTPPARRRPPRRALVTATAMSAAVVGAALAWGLTLPNPFVSSPAPGAPPRAMVVRASTPPVPVAPEATPPDVPPAAETPAPVAAAATPEHRNACLDLPTPGERLVCGYPSLAILDRRMTAAYERALDAAPNPQGLANAQAAWRRLRDGAWDREQLATMYDARIRDLEALSPAPPTP